jgi:hypothetical protein
MMGGVGDNSMGPLNTRVIRRVGQRRAQQGGGPSWDGSTAPMLSPETHVRWWRRVGVAYAAPLLFVLVAAVVSATSPYTPPPAPAAKHHKPPVRAVTTAGLFSVYGSLPPRLLPRKALLYAISRLGLETLTYHNLPAARIVPRTATVHNGRVTLVYDVYPSQGFLTWSRTAQVNAAAAVWRKTAATPAGLELAYTAYYYNYIHHNQGKIHTLAPEFIDYNKIFHCYVIFNVMFKHVLKGGVTSAWYMGYGDYRQTNAWLRAHVGRTGFERLSLQYAVRLRMPRQLDGWASAAGFEHLLIRRAGQTAAKNGELRLGTPAVAASRLAASLRLAGRMYYDGQVVTAP